MKPLPILLIILVILIVASGVFIVVNPFKTMVNLNDQSYKSGFTSEVYRGRRLVFETDPDEGFTVYSLAEGDNMVLILEREYRGDVPGTSILIVTELALELRGDPPGGQTLKAEEWIVKALYRFGGPIIQFESTKCTGTFVFDPKSEEGKLHGRLNLVFFDPKIDRSKFKEVPARIVF